MSKYIYNNTQLEKTYIGKSIAANSYYLIPVNFEIPFSSESSLIVDIANGEIILSKTDDSSGHISDISYAIDFLKDNLPVRVESQNYPFGSKSLPDGKKIFRRVRGVTGEVQNYPVNIDFIVPFAECKITGLFDSGFHTTCNIYS